jgi:hypothetical protein
MKKLTLVFLTVLFNLPAVLPAAEKDSVSQVLMPIYKNVIKFNPTPMILWDARNVTFSYERIVNPRQSVSIELGYLVLPRLFEDTIINLVNITSHQKQGLSATLEYRFYLTRLNTRPVPAGLYIGPYFTFYGYKFKNGFDILVNTSRDSIGMIRGNYWSFNLGAELGYQFVFWKRLTLDLVMVGPSISYYGGRTEITGELDTGQIQEINEAMYDKLIERYPAAQYLSVDKTIQQTGKLDIFSLGFRYLLQIGFHF